MQKFKYGLMVGTAVIGLTFASQAVFAEDESDTFTQAYEEMTEEMVEEMDSAMEAEIYPETGADSDDDMEAIWDESIPDAVDMDEAEDTTDTADEMTEYSDDLVEDAVNTTDEAAGEAENKLDIPASEGSEDPVAFEGDKEDSAAKGKRWWGRPY